MGYFFIQMSQISPPEFLRLANNFYTKNNIATDVARMGVDSHLVNYVLSQQDQLKTKYKVAFVWICLNPPYWQFAKTMIEGARQFFLPGHETDYFLWSDMPEMGPELEKLLVQLPTQQEIQDRAAKGENINQLLSREQIKENVESVRKLERTTIFPIEPIEWPMPTLMRYHTFLQQEEILSKYDYIFYCDVDMAWGNVVGDEVLGNDLTAALHPMYALRKEYWPPYEPNPESQAYIKRPGQVITENGKQRFMPMYFAGGFQGGKSDKFLQAMKRMKDMIDQDLANNYVPIWNDETIWNKYLFDNPPSTVLTPAYIYPDSLINEYYTKLWGCNYVPKLITLTKKFSISAEGGQHVNQMMETM